MKNYNAYTSYDFVQRIYIYTWYKYKSHVFLREHLQRIYIVDFSTTHLVQQNLYGSCTEVVGNV